MNVVAFDTRLGGSLKLKYDEKAIRELALHSKKKTLALRGYRVNTKPHECVPHGVAFPSKRHSKQLPLRMTYLHRWVVW